MIYRLSMGMKPGSPPPYKPLDSPIYSQHSGDKYLHIEESGDDAGGVGARDVAGEGLVYYPCAPPDARFQSVLESVCKISNSIEDLWPFLFNTHPII
jgi:hypothetical protein